MKESPFNNFRLDYKQKNPSIARVNVYPRKKPFQQLNSLKFKNMDGKAQIAKKFGKLSGFLKGTY